MQRRKLQQLRLLGWGSQADVEQEKNNSKFFGVGELFRIKHNLTRRLKMQSCFVLSNLKTRNARTHNPLKLDNSLYHFVLPGPDPGFWSGGGPEPKICSK